MYSELEFYIICTSDRIGFLTNGSLLINKFRVQFMLGENMAVPQVMSFMLSHMEIRWEGKHGSERKAWQWKDEEGRMSQGNLSSQSQTMDPKECSGPQS